MEIRTPSTPVLPPKLSQLRLSSPESSPTAAASTSNLPIVYKRYVGETEIPTIMDLVDSELSEPYNFYTYRYFLADWPHLCFMAYVGDLAVGTIVCKQEVHRDKLNRGYLAMLSTRVAYRGKGVATQLARLAMTEMVKNGCQEIVLETEADNHAALAFYAKLGFLKEKGLFRFYLNAKSAFRLALQVPDGSDLSLRRVEFDDGREKGDLVI